MNRYTVNLVCGVIAAICGYCSVLHAAPLQRDLKVEPKLNLPSMVAQPEKLTEKLVGETMPEQAAPVKEAGAETMPAETVEEHVKPQGMQEAPLQRIKVTPFVPVTDAHLHLVMEVSNTGEAKIVSATRIPRSATITNEVRGDFVYQIDLDGQVLNVEAIADPFELRSFPRPGAKEGEGHHFETAKTARIIVTVPNAKQVEERLDKLHIRFFKIKPGKELHTIDPRVFQELEKSQRLERIMELKPQDLSIQLKEHIKVVE